MLTPDQVQELQVAFEQLSEPLVNALITDIARRVSEAGQLTSTAAYEIWRAQNLGKSREFIEKAVADWLSTSVPEVQELFKQAAEVGYNFDVSRLPMEAVPFEENQSIQQVVSAAVDLADENLKNITQTLGVIQQNGEFSPLTDYYRKACDEAFMQVSAGVLDYNTAIRRACSTLAQRGIQTIDYESGVRTSLEAAVRRNMMGGLGLMVEDISRQNHDDLGCDGWEISAHAASAPDHEPIQGRQYPDEEYERLNNSLVRRIGTLNCGHTASPIILGVSEPQYTNAELAEIRRKNEEGVTVEGRHYSMYEATQKQRQIEGAIRTQKRRILIDEAAKDEEKLLTDQIRLRSINEEYRRFSKAAGLPTQRERAQIAGFGREKANDATKAAEQYYQDWSKAIGANNSIETLAKYYDVKYNDSPRYELLKGYARAVEKGDISPLVGFERYEEVSAEIQKRIVGTTASTGVTIESFATHFVDRVIGQTSTSHTGMRCGVSIEDVLDVLQNPVRVGATRVLKDGDIRQTLMGAKADVTISIRDKRLIQTNPNGG